MSEHKDLLSTSVLLPPARVDVFTLDQTTHDMALSVKSDWRFARVMLDVREGGIDAAIEKYTQEKSADLMIIQTKAVDESYLEKLDSLSAHCAENTSAVLVGPTNDVQLYRRLIGMGISDYLVDPISQSDFIQTISTILFDMKGTLESRLIAVTGSHSGVGASTMARLLAYGASDTLGHKTCLIDAQGPWSGMPVAFGFESSFGLQEALKAAARADEEAFNRMLAKPFEKLHVFAALQDSLFAPVMTAAEMETFLGYIMTVYPLVVVDLSGAAPDLQKAVIANAHETIVVTAPLLAPLRVARSLMKEIRDIRGGSKEYTDLIVNHCGASKSAEVPKQDIVAALDVEPALMIDNDPVFFDGLNGGEKTLLQSKQGKKTIASVLPFVQKVVLSHGGGEKKKEKKTDILGGLFAFMNKG